MGDKSKKRIAAGAFIEGSGEIARLAPKWRV
jgi:hypothetical protein